MELKAIPLNQDWTNNTKHDLHAIYLRRKEDNWGTPQLDALGREQWDATGPLPMRRHDDWIKKGYRYLTVAMTRDDHRWPMLAWWIRDQTGHDPETYIQDRRTRSTFNASIWAEGAADQADKELADLRVLVEQFGPDAVTAIQRRTNPHFVLPTSLLAQPSVAEAADAPVGSDGEVPTPVKRGPGRPRKAPVPEAVA